jgi:homoserine kinase
LPARSVHVRVPASSANLGPGYDCFAAALALHLDLEVSEAETFGLTSDLDLPRDRTNLVVRAFERLHPADGLHFANSSEIPLSGGLGSSAAAIVAGLFAAARLTAPVDAHDDADVFALACELEGHPDNVAAALHGGIVVCTEGEVHGFPPPPGLGLLLVVPDDGVLTEAARAALPQQVPLADAVYNTAHGALLMLGLQSGDLELVARGLRDRLHEPYRAALYPRSAALASGARELGALGATISGAGPSVLVWVAQEQRERVREALELQAAGWARVLTSAFEGKGAKSARTIES